MALWTPAEITTALWLDAADAATITLNSGKVSQWNDKSGNNRNVTQGSSTAQPTYGTVTLSGSGVLGFDGIDDRLVGGDILDIRTGDRCIFVVAKNNGINGTIVGKTSSASEGGRWAVRFRDSQMRFNLTDQSNISKSQDVTVSNLNQWNILYQLISRTEHAGWCNGTELFSNSIALSTGDIDNSAPFEIGSFEGGNSFFQEWLTGNIAEIIITDLEPFESDRQKIEGYLAWKWGLEANLPSGHPYEMAAPDDSVNVNIPAAGFTLTALAPTIGPVIADVPSASFTLTALAPTTSPAIVNIPAVAWTLAALAPTVQTSVDIPEATFSATAQAPTGSYNYAVPAAAFTLDGQAPTVSPVSVTVPVASFMLTALVPATEYDVFLYVVEVATAADELAGDAEYGLEEVATAAEALVSALAINAALVDAATVFDESSVIYFVDSTETATAVDVAAFVEDTALEETAVATDVAASSVAIVAATTEVAAAGDSLAVHQIGETTETATAVETLAGDFSSAAGLVEAGVASEGLTGVLAASVSATDAAVASDVLEASLLAASTELATASDVLGFAPVAAWVTLIDPATAIDALVGDLTVYAKRVTETAVATDVAASSLVLIGVLSDVALAGDALHESAQTVHVMNAETGAMSTYVFTPVVEGVADFHGVLYLAGPEGLYALDAEQDDDGAVVWTVKTGFSNLGTDLLKRVQDVNVQGRTEGDTTMQVTEARYGRKREWSYRLPPLVRESHRDGVVKPGRGLQSVYYGLGLRGTGPAEIDHLQVSVDPLSRRR